MSGSTLITSRREPSILNSCSTSQTDSRSVGHVTARSNRGDLERALPSLASEHGCGPNCAACERWRSSEGIPDPLARWANFIRSDRSRRIAHAARAGTAFPRLSVDEVTQFLIEEAAFTALDVFESQERAKASEESARGENLEAMARRAVGR